MATSLLLCSRESTRPWWYYEREGNYRDYQDVVEYLDYSQEDVQERYRSRDYIVVLDRECAPSPSPMMNSLGKGTDSVSPWAPPWQIEVSTSVLTLSRSLLISLSQLVAAAVEDVGICVLSGATQGSHGRFASV